MLFKIRKTKSSPQWIAPEYWSQMQEKFNSSAFQRVSNAAKKNRSLAGPSHTGGSISFSEHEDRERRSKGDAFMYKDMFKRLHKFQKGPKKGEFVSERSRKVLDDVLQIEDRYSSVDSSSSTACSRLIPNEKEIFMEAAGGMKKGRVFGLGSEGAAITRGKTCLSSMSFGSEETLMTEEFDKRVNERVDEKLKMVVPKMQQEMELATKEKFDAISNWMLIMSTQLGVSLPPIVIKDFNMVHVNVDDDDNNGAHDDGFTPPPDHHPSPGSGSNPPPPPPPPPSAAAPAQCAV